MNDDLETGMGQQFFVFGGIQTGMVERISSIAANALPVSRPGIEHQDRRSGGMCRKHLEHGTLIVRLEMEKAVPGERTGKLPSERK